MFQINYAYAFGMETFVGIKVVGLPLTGMMFGNARLLELKMAVLEE